MFSAAEYAVQAAHAPSPSAHRIEVLYIMGNPRSGSTILDTLLGNHPVIESVGELVNLPELGWKQNQFCACGHRARQCGFWEEVRESWLERTSLSGSSEYLRLQNRVGQYRRLLPGFETPDTASEDFTRYAECTAALFETIGEVSGKSIVVDSSKIPLRAYLLSLMPRVDLKLIHLVRDVRGVTWSLRKSFTTDERGGVEREIKPQAVAKTVVNWLRINAQSVWVRERVAAENSICVRYEALMADPAQTLERIGTLVGSDFQELVATLQQGRPLSVGHTISGNRMRMAGSVRLWPDDEWRSKMGTIDKWLIGSLAGWQMRRLR